MQKRAENLQADRLIVTNVGEHLLPAWPTDMTVTIELERGYGKRGAAMAPPSMPELLDMLAESPTPNTDEKASKYLAPSVPYLQAIGAQVSPKSNVR